MSSSEANFGMNSASKREDAVYRRLRETGYLFGHGVSFKPIHDAPRQEVTWPCGKCKTVHKSFEAFLYDGCSPVYPRREVKE